MKELTIKELSELISLPAGTVRSWTLKPVQGQPYSSSNVNYEALRAGIAKYYPNDEFKKQFGFEPEDIVLTKAERTSKNYADITDIKEGDMIILHNYSLQTKLVLVHITAVAEDIVYLFSSEKGYKAYSANELSKPCFKVEKVEA